MKPCISQVTTLPATFAEDIAAYADAGWHAVEIWLTKLETHLEQHSASDTRKLLEAVPMVEIDLALAPDEVLRRLFEAFRLEIHYDRRSHAATCRITITDVTPHRLQTSRSDQRGAAAQGSPDHIRQRRFAKFASGPPAPRAPARMPIPIAPDRLHRDGAAPGSARPLARNHDRTQGRGDGADQGLAAWRPTSGSARRG